MKTVHLPQELLSAPLPLLAVFEYESGTEMSKQQILLQTNTFSFLQEGTKEVFFDNASCIIDPKRFLLMKSGNCLMTEKLSDNFERYRSVLFFFQNDAILDFIRKFELDPLETLQRRATYSFDYNSYLHGFVHSILHISKLSKTVQEALLQVKFEEIMLYLIAQNGTSFIHSLVAERDDHTQRFIQTVQQNRLNKLHVEELAFLCDMSVSTFKRAFEKHFNSAPGKWFHDKRLEYSAFLLKSESKRPSDIYEEVGYETLSNFIQAFKVKFGVTPKQYQQN